MLPIYHGRLYFGVTLAEFVDMRMRDAAKKRGVSLYSLSDVAQTAPLRARVNHGNWIVDCECGGAEFAWEEGVVMCQSCWNSAVGSKWRPVVFPTNRAEIERTLMARPLPKQRNWTSETPDELRAENRTAGDPEEG